MCWRVKARSVLYVWNIQTAPCSRLTTVCFNYPLLAYVHFYYSVHLNFYSMFLEILFATNTISPRCTHTDCFLWITAQTSPKLCARLNVFHAALRATAKSLKPFNKERKEGREGTVGWVFHGSFWGLFPDGKSSNFLSESSKKIHPQMAENCSGIRLFPQNEPLIVIHMKTMRKLKIKKGAYRTTLYSKGYATLNRNVKNIQYTVTKRAVSPSNDHSCLLVIDNFSKYLKLCSDDQQIYTVYRTGSLDLTETNAQYNQLAAGHHLVTTAQYCNELIQACYF